MLKRYLPKREVIWIISSVHFLPITVTFCRLQLSQWTKVTQRKRPSFTFRNETKHCLNGPEEPDVARSVRGGNRTLFTFAFFEKYHNPKEKKKQLHPPKREGEAATKVSRSIMGWHAQQLPPSFRQTLMMFCLRVAMDTGRRRRRRTLNCPFRSSFVELLSPCDQTFKQGSFGNSSIIIIEGGNQAFIEVIMEMYPVTTAGHAIIVFTAAAKTNCPITAPENESFSAHRATSQTSLPREPGLPV